MLNLIGEFDYKILFNKDEKDINWYLVIKNYYYLFSLIIYII